MKYTYPDKMWVRPSDDEMKIWVLRDDFRMLDEDGNLVVTVPAGFRTDFASIPRIFRSIYPKTGRWGKPAVVHDYRYKTGQIPKAESDTEFRWGMLSQAVKKAVARMFYWAVKYGGGRSWRKHRANDPKPEEENKT